MSLYVAAKWNAYFLWKRLERVVFHLTTLDQSFVLTSRTLTGESCAYGLPRVVGMNTALDFEYLSHLYIENVFISQSKTRHKLFCLLNVGQLENIYL